MACLGSGARARDTGILSFRGLECLGLCDLGTWRSCCMSETQRQ